jgi:hypothetical protein
MTDIPGKYCIIIADYKMDGTLKTKPKTPPKLPEVKGFK